jgi:4-amino-4-deoxy-L-arabinose transferase-like glycosyltransferase
MSRNATVSRRWFFRLAALFLLSLCCRLGYVLLAEDAFMWPDETAYYNTALNLHAGNGFRNDINLVPTQYLENPRLRNAKPARFSAPGTSYSVAAVFSLSGIELLPLRIAHIVIMSFLPLAVLGLALLIHANRVAAWLAAFAVALYPFYVHLSCTLLPQNWLTLFAVLFSATLVAWIRYRRWFWAVLCGACGGLATLFVVPMLFATFAACAWMLLCAIRDRSAIPAPPLALLTALAIVGPYVLNISSQTGRFTLVTAQGHRGLLQHNNPYLSAGEIFTHTPSKDSADQISLWIDERQPAGYSAGRKMIAYVFDHPLKFGRDCLVRLGAFWSPITHTISKPFELSSPVNLVGMFIYLPTFMLGVLGFLRFGSTRGHRIPLAILVIVSGFLIPHVLMIANTRYRLPWDSLLFVFAAYWLEARMTAFRNRRSGAGRIVKPNFDRPS